MSNLLCKQRKLIPVSGSWSAKKLLPNPSPTYLQNDTEIHLLFLTYPVNTQRETAITAWDHGYKWPKWVSSIGRQLPLRFSTKCAVWKNKTIMRESCRNLWWSVKNVCPTSQYDTRPLTVNLLKTKIHQRQSPIQSDRNLGPTSQFDCCSDLQYVLTKQMDNKLKFFLCSSIPIAQFYMHLTWYCTVWQINNIDYKILLHRCHRHVAKIGLESVLLDTHPASTHRNGQIYREAQTLTVHDKAGYK